MSQKNQALAAAAARLAAWATGAVCGAIVMAAVVSVSPVLARDAAGDEGGMSEPETPGDRSGDAGESSPDAPSASEEAPDAADDGAPPDFGGGCIFEKRPLELFV